LKDVHKKQLLTYLKISGRKLGLLVNFNTSDITKDIVRIVNGL
jgi:GxxExxY protein